MDNILDEGDDDIGDIRAVDLTAYPTAQLEARVVFYERAGLFERDADQRDIYRAEVSRTEGELARRKAENYAVAEGAFK